MAETIHPTNSNPARVPDLPTVRLSHHVSSSLLTDQIYDAMRGWIAQGDWPPGTQLRIREVAKLVGTSEMPVREAFRRLEQAGLIVVEPYKGAVVRVLSIDELEHIYDVRIILEAEAGRHGALCADAVTVATMTQHWQQLQEANAAGDVAAAVAQDEQLLTTLYSAGPNDVLTRLVRELWDSCRPYKQLWVRNAVAQGISAWSHLPHLIEAVENHDGAVTSDLLAETYRDARATVRQLLTSGTQQ